MYKAFVAYEAQETLTGAAEEIDQLVLQHHGPVVRRKNPLHVTVMAPRVVTNDERLALEECTGEFNGQYGGLQCRLGALECFGQGKPKHFVVGVKGQKLVEVINHFHQTLEERFAWERRPFEGETPHVTLLNSKYMPPHVFHRVTRDARRIELPRDIELPRLVVHVRWANVKKNQQPTPAVEPETGWHP